MYVFGFVGGLFMVNNKVVNEDLDWTNPSNFPKFKELIGTATIPSPMVWGKIGDKVYITLINLGMPTAGIMDAHTVHMHGAHIRSYFDKEYVMLLSDIDTRWHDSVETGGKFNPVDFKPDFWLVNGRAFPDTLLPHLLTSKVGSCSYK